MQLDNGTMFQYFSWGIKDNGKLWTWLKESADHFRSLGALFKTGLHFERKLPTLTEHLF